MTNFLNSRPFLLSHVCYAISFESFKRNWCGKNGAFFNKTKHLEGKNKEFWSFKETGVTGVIFKMKPKINIIDLRLLERSLYAPIFTNVKIARNYIIFWWKCGKSRSQIWHCVIVRDRSKYIVFSNHGFQIQLYFFIQVNCFVQNNLNMSKIVLNL